MTPSCVDKSTVRQGQQGDGSECDHGGTHGEHQAQRSRKTETERRRRKRDGLRWRDSDEAEGEFKERERNEGAGAENEEAEGGGPSFFLYRRRTSRIHRRSNAWSA